MNGRRMAGWPAGADASRGFGAGGVFRHDGVRDGVLCGRCTTVAVPRRHPGCPSAPTAYAVAATGVATRIRQGAGALERAPANESGA